MKDAKTKEPPLTREEAAEIIRSIFNGTYQRRDWNGIERAKRLIKQANKETPK